MVVEPLMVRAVVIARHKRVDGAVITESTLPDDSRGRAVGRFTATVRGWRGFKICEGPLRGYTTTDQVVKTVTAIRDRIDGQDESVFTDKAFSKFRKC